MPLADAIAMLRIMFNAAGRLLSAPTMATVDRLVIGSGTSVVACRVAAAVAARSASRVSFATAAWCSMR